MREGFCCVSICQPTRISTVFCKMWSRKGGKGEGGKGEGEGRGGMIYGDI